MTENSEERGTFWIRTLAKGVSTVGAIVASICGIVVLISFSAKCVAMGIYMVAAGVCVLLLEATMCFLFLDIGKWLESKSDMIRPWQKMVVYFGMCLPAVLVCGSVTSWIGSIGFLVAGMSYMVLTIGPKGAAPLQNTASHPYERQYDDIAVA